MATFTPEVYLRAKNYETIQLDHLPDPEEFPWQRSSELTAPLLPGMVAHQFRLTGVAIERGSTIAETHARMTEAVRTAALAVGLDDGYELSDDPPENWRVKKTGGWEKVGKVGLVFRIVRGSTDRFAMNGVQCEYWLCVRDPSA